MSSYIVKYCKCFSDVLLLKVRIDLCGIKIRDHEPLCHCKDLRRHHEEEVWELDDARRVFINHVYEILQLFLGRVLPDCSDDNRYDLL